MSRGASIMAMPHKNPHEWHERAGIVECRWCSTRKHWPGAQLQCDGGAKRSLAMAAVRYNARQREKRAKKAIGA